MDARSQEDTAREDGTARPDEEQDADEALEDALRELEDARREEERTREAAESGRAQAGREGDREGDKMKLEEMAYTPGLNPVADSNVQAEREQARKAREEAQRREEEEQERERKDEEERERLRLAAVENRTYMIGRASMDILSDDLVALRILREHAAARERKEAGEEGRAGDGGQARGYSDFANPELVIVTEQAVCTTEQQARAFAFMQELDAGRAVVFNRHASSFAGETLGRLVENEHTALRTVETVDRALYPYSFGRPSDKLIAALRATILLFADTEDAASTGTGTGTEADTETGTEAGTDASTETGSETPSAGSETTPARQGKEQETGSETEVRARTRRLLTRESVTVVDKVVEREVQAESTDKEARRERRNRSFVDGPSHRREDTPLAPLRHVNSVQIAIDMTGEGDTRRKEEQFRTASPQQQRGTRE